MKPRCNRQGRPRLVLHLGIVLLLKFAVLAVLWHQFVVPYRVEVDARAMEQRLTRALPQANPKEHALDRSHTR